MERDSNLFYYSCRGCRSKANGTITSLQFVCTWRFLKITPRIKYRMEIFVCIANSVKFIGIINIYLSSSYEHDFYIVIICLSKRPMGHTARLKKKTQPVRLGTKRLTSFSTVNIKIGLFNYQLNFQLRWDKMHDKDSKNL